jgi:hypothetical protein
MLSDRVTDTVLMSLSLNFGPCSLQSTITLAELVELFKHPCAARYAQGLKTPST